MRLLKALVAASAILLFLGLGASTIWDANEAFYTETPRQMVESGDYVNPSFNGALRLNKPVLSYWVVAGFYKVFGVSVWSERVAIAIGTLGIAAAAFVIARLMGGARAAWIAALVILSAPRVVFFSRRIFIDVWITMFMSLVLMFFVLAEARPRHRRRYLLLMYVAAGLGVLTKGPVAVVLPGLAFFVYLAWQRRLGDILRVQLIPGALIVLAIVAPWYAMLYAEHGWEPIRSFFIGENVGRFSETVGEQDRPFLFYVPVLFTELFPWSLFLPVALWLAARGRGASRPSIERLLLAWIAAIVLLFTFSSTKQDLYIFPIVAAVAALISVAVDRWIEGKEHGLGFTTTWLLISLFLLAMSFGLTTLFGWSDSRYYLRGVKWAALILMLGSTAISFAAMRRRLYAAVALGATMVAANYVLVLRALPDFERFKPVAPLSATARQRNPDARVVQYRVALPSMVWYLGKPVEEILDLPVLQERLAREGETLVLLKEGDYPDVQSLGPTCIIDRRPLLDLKLREIIADTALPEMLLVSNRCD